MKLSNKQNKTYMMISDIVDFNYEDKIALKKRLFEYFEYEDRDYKQALIDIRKIITECKMLMSHEFDWEEQIANILQKIDKVLGGRE